MDKERAAAGRLRSFRRAGCHSYRSRQPVCTPRLLAKHGVVNTRQDLERYHLLHSKSEPWRGWPGGALEDEIFMGDEWGRAAHPAMIQLRSYTQPKQARASRWHVRVW
jgi:hypothetical protein